MARRPALIRLTICLACSSLFIGPSPCAADDPIPSGWSRISLAAAGHYADRYLPASLDRTQAAPMVVFLHGSGSGPSAYRSVLEDAADELGLILLLPKSVAFEGWGTSGDRESIAEAVQSMRGALLIDSRRTAIAGHSSGGAYAVVIGLEDRGWCAVFSLASPAVGIGPAGDPLYDPPVHLFYGADDPNFSSQAAFTLIARIEAHGNEVELDVRSGFGHNSWPADAMVDGLRFLVEHPRPAPQRPPASEER